MHRPESPGAPRRLVLFVDDEPDVTKNLSLLMRKQSFQVRTANSADEALAILAAEPVDVVVSDERMPEMCGSDFLTLVRREHPDVTRIILTGQASVEATVKAGMRHTAPKRTFYLDEDSWGMVLAEDYDAQGKLAKVREGFLIPVYETGSCDVSAFVQHNLTEGRYLFDMHAAGTGTDVRWMTEPEGARFSPEFYTADNLRSVSER